MIPDELHYIIEENTTTLEQMEAILSAVERHIESLAAAKPLVSGCTEYLEQMLNRVQEYNAVAKDQFVKEQSANDLHALRRVLRIIREIKPV